MLLVEIDDNFLANDMLAEMSYVNGFVGVLVMIYNAELMAAFGMVFLALERW